MSRIFFAEKLKICMLGMESKAKRMKMRMKMR